MLMFIIAPAAIAFAIAGAISWDLKCAVRWAVAAGIAVPTLLFGWLLYGERQQAPNMDWTAGMTACPGDSNATAWVDQSTSYVGKGQPCPNRDKATLLKGDREAP